MHPESFVGGAPPGPAGGAYSAPPDPLARFKGPTSKEGEGWGREGTEGEGTEGEWRSGEGKGRKGREWDGRERARACSPPRPTQFSGYATGVQFYFWRAAE